MGARGPKPTPFRERVRRHIVIDDGTGCHLWTGAVDRKGYAKAGSGGAEGRTVIVHRYLHELERGSLPSSTHLHHVCGVRRCVNVDHLRPLSAAEHLAEHDTHRVGAEAAAAKKRASTHCRRGHEFTPENTKMQAGARACRTCIREGARRRNMERLGFPATVRYGR